MCTRGLHSGQRKLSIHALSYWLWGPPDWLAPATHQTSAGLAYSSRGPCRLYPWAPIPLVCSMLHLRYRTPHKGPSRTISDEGLGYDVPWSLDRVTKVDHSGIFQPTLKNRTTVPVHPCTWASFARSQNSTGFQWGSPPRRGGSLLSYGPLCTWSSRRFRDP
eukprot:scaffold115_cov304-Prasinococcus_capsulatus_cf.AAC.18